ncbi:hypothetical protein AGMMS49925_10280 [Deltaproteobacteria bacterium]|nr:hypothetical protein AGMMS49925_10280 [Deltaproteobacteria bacterium]
MVMKHIAGAGIGKILVDITDYFSYPTSVWRGMFNNKTGNGAGMA